MEHQPKTEPGLPSSDRINLEDMSIHELVSVLRIAFVTEDFDRVEEVLVSRYQRLQTEILQLQEKFQMEKLMRLQAEEDLRKREELCERGKKAQDNYEKLLKEVKRKTSLGDRDTIEELRKKNNELELEVFELRKLKEKWLDDNNAFSEPPRSKDAQDGSLDSSLQPFFVAMLGKIRKKNNKLELDVCELRKLMEKWVDDCDALSEPPSKRRKDAHGASSSSVTALTRGATVDAAHFGHGHPITSLCRECAARHAPIVDERQENDDIHMSEEVIVTDSVVAPPSDVQEQMATQNKAKRKKVATNASSSSFDNFKFISLVHQERYLKFLTNKKFVLEKNFRLEGDKFSDIQAVIMTRGWGELTSFAKEASTTLAKEFFANAYLGASKEDGNYKNDLMKFTSFVRGKKVPFHEKIINQLFGLENYEQCSFEARKAKGSNIDHQEILNTLCKPKADWVRNKDGTPRKLHSSDLTPIAKAWATFVLHTLLPCSNVSDLTIQKATLLTAILKGEPVNVGRLLANDLWATANCSSPTSYINHASLINKLCERVRVYPEKNEEIVKPSGPITAKWIEKNPL